MIKLDETNQKGVYRWWFITWNNPPQDWKAALDSLEATYTIGQLEKGREGTLHIQACIYYVTSRRASSFKGLPMWIKGVSSADAKLRVCNYVSKSDTRVDGPYESGSKPAGLSKGRDWEEARKLAKEGRFEEIQASIFIPYYSSLKKINNDAQRGHQSEDCRGLWIYGYPGAGKSHYAREELGQDAFNKAQSKWFDGYQGEECILLDDLDKRGECLGHLLKIWLDKWPCSGEVKGGTVPLKHRVFAITSNYLPEDLWGDDDILVTAIRRRCIFVFFRSDRTPSMVEPLKLGVYPE